MGIYNALFTGASGLRAFGESVRVIGDNISNVNSLGFKSQDVQFGSVLSQTIGSTQANIPLQVGGGVKIAQISQDNRQGSVQNTTSATDMAINGNGMFAVKNPASGQTLYSRAGSFMLDKSSTLIDAQGNVVQGWATDTKGVATGNVTDIAFSNLASQAKATSAITAGVTIDATAQVLPATTAFDPTDPNSFHYKTQVNAYDGLGSSHQVSLYYTKTANNTWSWQAGVNSIDLVGKQTPTDTGEPLIVGPNAYNIANKAIPINAASAGASISGNATFDAPVTINGTLVPAGTPVKNVLNSAVIANASGIVSGTAVNMVTGNVVLPTTAAATATTLGVGKNIPNILPAGTTIAAGTQFSQAVTINGTTYTAGTLVPATTVTSFSSTSQTSAIQAGSVSIPSNQLMFGPAGELVLETGASVNFPWTSAAASNISFDFGNATTVDAQGTIGSGQTGTVQMGGAFATRQMTVDGFSSGFLDKLETDSTGRIFGVFTNGQRRSLYQVALAKFPNDSVLTKVGNNLQQESIASGAPVLEKPGNGGMGTITPYGLEQSNVDLANQFVKLIVAQRGYEANSKTILTTDQMLSSLMQLKR